MKIKNLPIHNLTGSVSPYCRNEDSSLKVRLKELARDKKTKAREQVEAVSLDDNLVHYDYVMSNKRMEGGIEWLRR